MEIAVKRPDIILKVSCEIFYSKLLANLFIKYVSRVWGSLHWETSLLRRLQAQTRERLRHLILDSILLKT